MMGHVGRGGKDIERADPAKRAHFSGDHAASQIKTITDRALDVTPRLSEKDRVARTVVTLMLPDLGGVVSALREPASASW
jgi:hypothetical protein